ncbi:MAG: hypothetical protein JKY49_02035 [Cohaesibacteraceae bacterium]|nr:hypothetical protein [Cohaesibacteraceae bacterium]MBL4876265.1 hypothetical protein [Cohaesibacteraceae bacterium]
MDNHRKTDFVTLAEVNAVHEMLIKAKISPTPNGGLVVFAKLPYSVAYRFEFLRNKLVDLEVIH